MIGNADIRRKEPSEKVRRLVRLMKELRFAPETGYGESSLEVDWLNEKINMVKVTTKIKPE